MPLRFPSRPTILNAIAIKLKALLRTEAAHTIPDLWAASNRLLAHFNQPSATTTSQPQDTTETDRMPL